MTQDTVKRGTGDHIGPLTIRLALSGVVGVGEVVVLMGRVDLFGPSGIGSDGFKSDETE